MHPLDKVSKSFSERAKKKACFAALLHIDHHIYVHIFTQDPGVWVESLEEKYRHDIDMANQRVLGLEGIAQADVVRAKAEREKQVQSKSPSEPWEGSPTAVPVDAALPMLDYSRASPGHIIDQSVIAARVAMVSFCVPPHKQSPRMLDPISQSSQVFCQVHRRSVESMA